MTQTDFLFLFIPVVLSKRSLQNIINTATVGLVVVDASALSLLQKCWHEGDFIQVLYLFLVMADVVLHVNAV